MNITNFLNLIFWKKELVKINGVYVYLTPLCMSSSFKSHYSFKYALIAPINKEIIVLTRNPVDRFLSFYNKKILGRNLNLRKKIWYYVKFKNKINPDSINSVISYIENQSLISRDKHVKPISFFINYYSKKNKVLVLNPFDNNDKLKIVKTLGSFPTEQKFSSKSRSLKVLKQSDLSYNQLLTIKKLMS